MQGEYGNSDQGGWEWDSFPATPGSSITTIAEVSRWDVKAERPRQIMETRQVYLALDQTTGLAC